MAIGKDGKELYVFADYDGGNVAMTDLASGAKTNLFPLYGTNSSATSLHISGIATKLKPGYVTVSTHLCHEKSGAACSYSNQWFRDKVLITELKASPIIYNVAHNQFGDAGYFSEPQAVPSYDLSKILFVTTWRSTSETGIASYMVDIPVSSLP